MSTLYEAALELAGQGIPIFPCVPMGKAPATANGFKDATTDAKQISAWWDDNPEYNIAFEPEQAGLCVIDVDPPGGADNLFALECLHEFLPETYTVITPRGGTHYYFKGSLPPSAGKLGPNIDTRGRGSYVLLPPSRTSDGVYVKERSGVEPLPSWVMGALTAKQRERLVAERDIEWDLPHNVEKARLWLLNRASPMPGERNNEAYKAACMCRDLGLSPERTEEMVDAWSGCEETSLVVWSVFEQGNTQNEGAVYAEEKSAKERFGHLVPVPDPSEPPPRAKYHPKTRAEQRQSKPPTYLIEKFLPEEGVVVWAGASGSYKTFAVLDMLMSVANGRPAFGSDLYTVHKQGDAVMAAGEAPADVEVVRVPAWDKERGGNPEAPFYLIEDVPPVIDIAEVDQFIEDIAKAGKRPRIVVIDTVSVAMIGLDENSAKDANIMMAAAQRIRAAFKCCVILIHHTGKDETRGPRGSTNFKGRCDGLFIQTCTDEDRREISIFCDKLKGATSKWTVYLRGDVKHGSVVLRVVDPPVKPKAPGAVTRQEISLTLRNEGVIEGQAEPVTTSVLADMICGPVASEAVKASKVRVLNRGASNDYHAFVAHLSQHKGDPTLWHYPKLNGGDNE